MKGKNWKELVIEHGEKGVLGMILCFVLLTIALTQWSTYPTKPEEFADKVRNGESNFAASVWTDEEKQQFEARDPGDEVARLLEGQPLTPTYEYSTKWVWPLHKRRQKVKEPEYMPVLDLVSDYGRVLIELLDPEAQQNQSKTGVIVADANDPDVVGPKGAPTVDGPSVETPRVQGPRRPQQSGSGALMAGTTPGLPSTAGGDYMASGSMGEALASGRKPEGKRFASVRGVIPMKSQIAKMQQALNLDTPQEAAQFVQYWDFELERQQAVADAKPWSGPWEPVNLEYAVDMVNRMEFDIDVIDEQYRDAVFTMPLPYRLSGNWTTAAGTHGILASHPQIKKLLTEKEQEEAEKRAQASIKAAELAQAKQAGQKKGFAGAQVDIRGIQGQMRNNTEMSKMYNDTMMEYMAESGSDQDSAANRQMYGYGSGMNRMNVVATPELLLFRFFDFTVVPGNAYRYRVRLELKNPNFDREPSELLDVSSREGEFRYTPWSQPSIPTVIEEESDVYVQKIDPRRETVAIDAYQWMTDSGTYVKGTLEGVSRGEQIAEWTKEVTRRGETETQGGITTPVLRPAEETFFEEQIDFVTPNILVDFRQESLLSPDDHPELELSSKRIAGTLNAVVMVNRFGDIVELDTDSQSGSYTYAQSRMDALDKAWGFLKEASNPAAGGASSGIDGLLGGSPDAMTGMEGMEGYGGAGGKGGRTRGRKSSALKKGGGQSDYMQDSYNPYSSGQEMMQQYGRGSRGGSP